MEREQKTGQSTFLGMSTEKGTYQAPAGAAVPVKGEVIATQPAETVHAVVAGFGGSLRSASSAGLGATV